MSEHTAPDVPRAHANRLHLTTVEAADYLRISRHTLDRFRIEGGGPRFCKAGPGLRSRVLYRKEDLDSWLAQYVYSSTSEYGAE